MFITLRMRNIVFTVAFSASSQRHQLGLNLGVMCPGLKTGGHGS